MSQFEVPQVPHVESKSAGASAWLLSTEQRAREELIATEEVRNARVLLSECYKREGVNHYARCKAEADNYMNVVLRGPMRRPAGWGASEDDE